MSVWPKRAGVSNIKIPPIRAQPQQTSTNERSGPACLDDINFPDDDLADSEDHGLKLIDIPWRREIVQDALAKSKETGHVLRSVQPVSNVALCKGGRFQ